MEYARAEKINRSRRGRAPVLAGAATMFSVRALREVYASRGMLYKPVLTEDYELSLALRVHGYETMAPRNCFAHTDLMPTVRMLWAQRLRWYRGAFESLRDFGFRKNIRSDIGWLAFSLWAAASRWLFIVALGVVLFTAGHMTFSPMLLPLFAFASFIRMVQVKELGWKYVLLAGVMVEELYYAFFLEAVLWRSAYLAFFAKERRKVVKTDVPYFSLTFRVDHPGGARRLDDPGLRADLVGLRRDADPRMLVAVYRTIPRPER